MSQLFRQRFQIFDLLDEISLLVVELLVVLTVVVELGQEVDQLVLVPEKDVQDRLWLVGIRDEHLEQVGFLNNFCPFTKSPGHNFR